MSRKIPTDVNGEDRNYKVEGEKLLPRDAQRAFLVLRGGAQSNKALTKQAAKLFHDGGGCKYPHEFVFLRVKRSLSRRIYWRVMANFDAYCDGDYQPRGKTEGRSLRALANAGFATVLDVQPFALT